MNKKLLSLICIVLFAFVALPAFCSGEEELASTGEVTSISTTSAATSKLLASVKLVSNVDITQDDVDNLINEYSANGYDMSVVTQEEVLEYLIQQALLMQGYAKAGYVDSEMNMTEETLNNVLNYYVYLLSQQGIQFETIDSFNAFLEQNSIDINQVIMYYAPDYLSQQYLTEFYSDILSDIPSVSEDDVNTFFNDNKAEFVNSEKVKIAHVFFAAEDETAKKSAKALADSVYSQIKSGKLTFEKAVTQYSNDEETKEDGGVLGWVNQTETDFEQMVGITPEYFSDYHKAVFGENIYNSIFNYDNGDITPVLESPYGYHIFKIINHQNVKTLGMNDKVYPEMNGTVKDFIVEYLNYIASQMAIQNAENQMFSDLYNESVVTIY